MRLDLLLSRPDTGAHTAIELKYLTALWAGDVAGERYALKSQGAQDVRAYDVVKDIGRLERFVDTQQNWTGLFVGLTNDPSFWHPVTHGRPTNADAFRIYDGVTLSGTRAWGPKTGAGTMRHRELPIELTGTHRLTWREYSKTDNTNRGTFRALIVNTATKHVGHLGSDES